MLVIMFACCQRLLLSLGGELGAAFHSLVKTKPKIGITFQSSVQPSLNLAAVVVRNNRFIYS